MRCLACGFPMSACFPFITIGSPVIRPYCLGELYSPLYRKVLILNPSSCSQLTEFSISENMKESIQISELNTFDSIQKLFSTVEFESSTLQLISFSRNKISVNVPPKISSSVPVSLSKLLLSR